MRQSGGGPTSQPRLPLCYPETMTRRSLLSSLLALPAAVRAKLAKPIPILDVVRDGINPAWDGTVREPVRYLYRSSGYGKPFLVGGPYNKHDCFDLGIPEQTIYLERVTEEK
jgi:hypothetical protein